MILRPQRQLPGAITTSRRARAPLNDPWLTVFETSAADLVRSFADTMTHLHGERLTA
jgi:hypothetical protein